MHVLFLREGLPLEILALDFWVPEVSTRMETPRFANAKVFKEILSTSEQTCLVYIKRAVADFERATGPGSTAKAKKNAMLSEEDHLALHDNCCLWTWLLPKLQNEFQGQTVEKYQDLFYKGCLGECVNPRTHLEETQTLRFPAGAVGDRLWLTCQMFGVILLLAETLTQECLRQTDLARTLKESLGFWKPDDSKMVSAKPIWLGCSQNHWVSRNPMIPTWLQPNRFG